MTNNPVGWFEIYVQDMARAKAFYETVLGVTLDKLEAPLPGLDMYAFPMAPNAPGAAGALVKIAGYPSGGNSVLVYFSCDDCGVEAGRVVKAGGRMEREKTPIGEHGYIALAFDTEDNLFGLHSRQ